MCGRTKVDRANSHDSARRQNAARSLSFLARACIARGEVPNARRRKLYSERFRLLRGHRQLGGGLEHVGADMRLEFAEVFAEHGDELPGLRVVG
jgi:hypothetical protein